jgi:hypothetical protein
MGRAAPAPASRAGRLDRLRQAKAQLQAAAAARQQAYQQRRPPGRKPRTLKRRPEEAPNQS